MLEKTDGVYEIQNSCVSMKRELDLISTRLEEVQKALLLLEFLRHGGEDLRDNRRVDLSVAGKNA